MNKIVSVAVAAVLLSLGLTACNGGSSDECDDASGQLTGAVVMSLDDGRSGGSSGGGSRSSSGSRSGSSASRGRSGSSGGSGTTRQPKGSTSKPKKHSHHDSDICDD